MPIECETERLRKVYQIYRESRTVQARWDTHNPGNRATLQERHRTIRGLLRAHGFWPLNSRRVLEVGCGSGDVLAGLLELGAQPQKLVGIDLLPDRIADARRRYPNLRFQCANAEQLDFPDNHFDLILLFTVFSSILDQAMAARVAQEVCRVLKRDGAVLWYDFRYSNPRNRHVRGMTLSRICHLFPNLEMHLRTTTLLPPLARRLGRLTRVLYPLMAAVAPLRTHRLGLLVKPTTDG